MTAAINLEAKPATFADHWSPRTMVTDGFLLVLKGELDIEMLDRTAILNEGGSFIVPKNTEHKPVARRGEVHLLRIEPSGTPNTGDRAAAAGRQLV